MTRQTIKEMMIEKIHANLVHVIEETVIDFIDEDVINEFLWANDYGTDIIHEFIDEHSDELVEDYLTSIYLDIDTDDLETPW